MKKFLKAALAAALTASMAGCSVKAESDSSDTKKTDDNKTEEKSSKNALSYSSDQTGKEETVYVFTDANGTQNKLIVSDKLHTAGKSGAVQDYSDLKDIVNVSGDETFTQGNDGKIVWQSDGSDISYQGISDKEIPVSVKVTYYLDGNEVSPDKISGASGHVKIRYDYTNNAAEQVTVDGKNETVKVPFAMVTGLILNDSFSNVSVTNGKLMQYENNSIVYGIAFPGLKDSLDLASYKDIDLDKYDIPDYVEVEGDTTNFGIDMSMTYASSNLLNEIVNTDDVDLSDISSQVDELNSAATQLTDGTKTLKDGTSKLKDGTSSLYSGAQTLANGTSVLANGASTLAAGASTAYNGASQLSNGLGKISANSASLNNGANQIAQGILDTANQQLKANDLTKDLDTLTLDNYATVLGNALGKDKLRAAALQQVEADVKAQDSDVDENTVKALIYMASIHATGNLTNDLTTQGARAKQALKIKSATSGYTGKDSAVKSKNVQAVLAGYKQYLLNNITVPAATDDQMTNVYKQIAATVRNSAEHQLDNLNDDQVNAIVAYALSNGVASISPAALQTLLPMLKDPKTAAQIFAIDYKNNDAYKAFAQSQYESAYKKQYTDTVNAMDTSALYDAVAKAITSKTGITDAATISKLIGYTCDNYDQKKSLDDQLTANGSVLNDAVAVQQEMANAATPAGQEKINGALDVQINGNAEVAAGKEQLDTLEKSLDGVSQFVEGLKAYTAGVDSAYAGSKDLVSGLDTLNKGAASLSSGAAQLNSGASTLLKGVGSLQDGVVQLDSGADTLMNGMQQFYDEGIKKISDLFNGELSSVVDRVKAVVNSGTDYTTYGGALDDKNNTVRFIFKTDTINADDSNN